MCDTPIFILSRNKNVEVPENRGPSTVVPVFHSGGTPWEIRRPGELHFLINTVPFCTFPFDRYPNLLRIFILDL